LQSFITIGSAIRELTGCGGVHRHTLAACRLHKANLILQKKKKKEEEEEEEEEEEVC
jgi:hypothetical protein